MNDHADRVITQSLAQEPALCANCAIRHSSLCGALTSEEIQDMNAVAIRKKLVSGKSFIFEGDAERSFANVTEGVAKLVRGSEDGRLQIVGLLFPSDFLGSRLSETGHGQIAHSIEAVSDMELCVFPRSKFESLLTKYPALEHKLLKRTLSELHVAREWMVLLGRKTAQERVATFLLHVSDRMKNVSCKGQVSFDLPLGRSEIADYIGLTLETVSRQFSKLRREKIIVIEGTKHITFIDEKRLRERANF